MWFSTTQNDGLTSLCQSFIVLHVIKIKIILKLLNILPLVYVQLCMVNLELIASRHTHPYEASIQWSWDNLKPAVVNTLSSMFNMVM